MSALLQSLGYSPGWKRWGTWAALACFYALPFLLAFGAPMYFLKIDGIDGESSNSKHKGEIEVESWSWGESNTGTSAGGGGGGAGKVKMQDFTFSMRVNKSSPKLFLACANGEHIKKAVLSSVKVGKDQQDYLKWTFTDLVVTSFQTKADLSPNSIPLDQVSFNFAQIAVEYKETRPDGSLGAAVTAGWNVKENRKLNEIPVDSRAMSSLSLDASLSETDDAADPDGDGLPNTIEALLGTNPRVADAEILKPHVEARGNQRYLALEITRMKDAQGRLSAETSENLREWFGGGVIEEVLEETASYTKLHLLVPMDRAYQFLRLRVDQ